MLTFCYQADKEMKRPAEASHLGPKDFILEILANSDLNFVSIGPS